MSERKPFASIYDTGDGQCEAGAMVAGEYFRCQLASDHTGWGHQSSAGSLIWRGDEERNQQVPGDGND